MRSPSGIPNLWNNADARRLYSRYLLKLEIAGRHKRIVTASRAIRRYASRCGCPNDGLFTFHTEINALCELKDYKAAWRQFRRYERTAYGKQTNLRRRCTLEDVPLLVYSYAPLLYFLGRYREGCKALEKALDVMCIPGKTKSYDLLFSVFNGDPKPTHRFRVTLAHFYDRLGFNLRDWKHWCSFVDGFHPRLFRIAKVSREDLSANADLLPTFFNCLMTMRDERTPTGIGGSQSDLIESASKVGKRQKALQSRLDEFAERIKPVRRQSDQMLRKLFPELRQAAAGKKKRGI
jgi:hypothetical protein